MRQTKHVLFAFSPYTYKAVEAYLNRQAARGWALERIGPFEQLARFRRTDRSLKASSQSWRSTWVSICLLLWLSKRSRSMTASAFLTLSRQRP